MKCSFFSFFLKNLLSFSLHIVQVLLSLFVYKCPSNLEARSGKRQCEYIYIGHSIQFYTSNEYHNNKLYKL